MSHPAPPFYRTSRPGRGRAAVAPQTFEGQANATGTISVDAGNAADSDTVTVDASALAGPAPVFSFVAEVAATGSITPLAEASLVEAETFTISDGTTAVVFEFDLAGGNGVGGGNVAVVLSGASTADQVRDAIISAVAGAVFDVTATNGGAATVTLTNDNVGATGNVAVSDTVANAGFIVSGMSGGVAAVTSLEVAIGASIDDSAANLLAKVNDPANGLTPYLVATPVGGASGDVLVAAAATAVGVPGNSITLQATGANLTPGAATALTGGVDSTPTGTLSGSKPNASIAPLVHTNGIGERTLYVPRSFRIGTPKVDL